MIKIRIKGYPYTIKNEDIIYFQACVNYTYIHLVASKPILISKTLKVFHNQFFNNNNFIRIHQSYLINRTHIDKIYKNKRLLVLMSNQDMLNVSRSNKNIFFEQLTT